MGNNVDISEFCRDVERMCDFILDRVPRDGTDDVTFVQKLKDRASDIQAQTLDLNIDGLHQYIRGG